jgi:hypothetical protein
MDLMGYLGDTPETNFKQAQPIHWLALPEEYRNPSTESALAHKLGVNRTALYGCKKGPYLRIPFASMTAPPPSQGTSSPPISVGRGAGNSL